MRTWGGIFLIRVVNIVFSVIEFFIGLRIVLRLFSANPASVFVTWIYSVSGALLYPFSGMFTDVRFAFGILDVNALIGLVLYGLVFSIITWVIRMLAATPGNSVVEERHQVA